MSDLLLHPVPPDERPWKFLLPVLALAFVARAAIALSGDFVLHPDEIMQYLEPAHRLVFGNGATYWEFFYGARSWLVPGLVAGVLKLFDIVGLGQPAWYVGGVKLVFCAISLLIPAGMYFFARCHFGETVARVALLMGAFWYELVGFAHKPMTEFVATALLMSLLALCVRPETDRLRMVLTAALAVLVVAVRVQYAPLGLLVFGLFFYRTGKKAQFVLIAASFLVAIGIFDAITWDGGLFHSYIVYTRVNLALGGIGAGESPAWQYLYWLLIASMGLVALCVLAILYNLWRYGLLLALIALTLLIHSTQSHKEYRFIFVVIPLWLLIGADFVVWFASRASEGRSRMLLGPTSLVLTASFAAISLAGILNALPYSEKVYKADPGEVRVVRFLRNQDPIFAAYRYLASAPGVSAVWQTDRRYFNLPGYYYLHRAIPLYCASTDRYFMFADQEKTDLEAIAASVSHIVTANPATSISGYSVEKTFGAIRILRRDTDEPAIRKWQRYTPTFKTGIFGKTVHKLYPDAPTPPPNAGIRFVDP